MNTLAMTILRYVNGTATAVALAERSRRSAAVIHPDWSTVQGYACLATFMVVTRFVSDRTVAQLGPREVLRWAR